MLAEARTKQEAFVIGIDAVAAAMAEASRRASAKAARGGVSNAMFLCASAESLPGDLTAVADAITVNFPWGSLLRALATSEERVLAKIAATAKLDGRFTALINMQPLRNVALAAKLGLAGAALLHEPAMLGPAYARAGLGDLQIRDVTNEAHAATGWGKHLAASRREVWRLDARVNP